MIKQHKVFITGIAGIGKSEFVKAYANKHKKEYTNILYFSYNGSLQNMITDMDFAMDLPDDDDTERFRKHNRFLRNLKEDTLIIIDNFNTSVAKEPFLNVIMKYNCRIIFTTRSKFETGTEFELNEISDIDKLIEISEYFYSDTKANKETIIKIIETVHRHTLSVEMSARLLQKGILEPNEVLQRLSECNVNPDTTDKFDVTKDGISSKATYYNHIHTLFSLYTLDENMQNIMRCMTFISSDGIRARMFAKWLNLDNLNDINELIELGYIHNSTGDTISLHLMLHEITIADLKPSVSNCIGFLNSIEQICLCHGKDISYSKLLFNVIERIISIATKDNINMYIRFIEDAFSYMDKCMYEKSMQLIVSEMEKYKNELQPNDMALLYDCKSAIEAMFGKSMKKAIDLSHKAVNTCIPEQNKHLAANLNMNLGYYYHMNSDLDSAKLYMEKGIAFMSEHNELNNDIIIMLHNYSNLMSDCGEPLKAIRAMKKCAEMIKQSHTDMCSDYADLYFDIGIIYLQTGDMMSAESYVKKAFEVYAVIFAGDENAVAERLKILSEFTKGTSNFESLIKI